MNASILKIIAMVTMLIDHIGAILFPDIQILRIIGRLSFPIFAYFIAEGCIYTKSHSKYLMRILICATVFQVIDCIIRPGCPPSVLWAYAASVGFVMLYRWSKQKWNVRGMTCIACAFMISLLLLIFRVDYFFFGFLFIISAYLLHDKRIKWIPMTLSLFGVGFLYGHQFWALLSIPLLMLHDGQKDKLKLGRFMYYFYPLHFLLLGVIQYVVNLG